VKSLEEALQVLKDYEDQERSRFVCTKRQAFGKKGMFSLLNY